MGSKFTLAEEVAYFRNRCAQQAQEIRRLESEKGLEHLKAKCERESEEKNKELKGKVKTLESEKSSLQKELGAVKSRLAKAEKRVELLTSKISGLEAERDNLKAKVQEDKTTIRELTAKLGQLQKNLDGSKEKCSEEVSKLQEKITSLEATQAEDKKRITELEKQIVSLGGQVAKLEHQAKLGSTTSSKPTSVTHYRKPIQNNRKKTDKPQGAQEEHPHHARKVIEIPGKITCDIWGLDDPLWENPEYSFERMELKHVVKPVMMVVDQYVYVPVFRNVKTGAHKNVACPDWMKDEMNYSPEAKALLLYMNVVMNASIEKSKDFMDAFSYGNLSPSEGFINKLSSEFAIKSEPERAEAFKAMIDADVMNVDGTTIRVGGVLYNITICVAGRKTLYFFRPYKGEKGVTDTPIETTTAILVSDHDVTYYSYGCAHQECLEHILRYLLDSIEVEPEYTWNIKMYDFVQKLIHEAKTVDEQRNAAVPDSNGQKDPEIVFETSTGSPRFSDTVLESYKKEYRQIIDLGLEEYEKNPNKTWYTKGINLCKRMNEKPESYLLFMENDKVPYTNNNAELEARIIKRKIAAALEFRGFLGVIAYCESMSVIQMVKRHDEPTLRILSTILSRETADEDVLRIERLEEKTLSEVIEKDNDSIEDLKKKLDAINQDLAKAESALADAKEACEKAGLTKVKPDTELTKEEQKLKASLDQAEHQVYLFGNDVKETQKKIAHRERHRESAIKKRAKTLEHIQVLEKRIAESVTNTAKATTEKPQKAIPPIVDQDAIQKAEAEVIAKKEQLLAAMDDLDRTNHRYFEIVYPPSEITVAERKSVFMGNDQGGKSSEEAVKAKEAVEKAKETADIARKEYEKALKALDVARKGRKPGRRAKKKLVTQENPEKAAV